MFLKRLPDSKVSYIMSEQALHVQLQLKLVTHASYIQYKSISSLYAPWELEEMLGNMKRNSSLWMRAKAFGTDPFVPWPINCANFLNGAWEQAKGDFSVTVDFFFFYSRTLALKIHNFRNCLFPKSREEEKFIGDNNQCCWCMCQGTDREV